MTTRARTTSSPSRPPAAPRTARGRFGLVVVAAVLVAGGASQTIAALRGGADQSRQAATAVALLESGINRQAALRWESAGRATLDPSLAAALDAARADIQVVLTGLARVERASFGLRELTEGAASYERALDGQLRTIAGDPERAARIGRTEVEPAFRAFRQARDEAGVRLAAAAETAGTAADLGTLFALMSAAILVSLLFRKWERTHRRAAWAEGARTGVEASEARFRSLVQHTSDLVTVVEADGRVAYVSPSVATLLGELETVGQSIFDLVHPDDAAVVRRALDVMGAGSSGQTSEWRLRGPAGTWRTFEHVLSPGRDALRGRVILTGRDVTERKTLEERLRHQAHHDPLTGLANRALLHETLQRATARSRRQRTTIALFMVDLDRFKAVNDTFGHAAGDDLLTGIADRLRRSVRAESLVARISGDEFAILLEDVDSPEAADHVAARILEAMREPFLLRTHAVAASLSIGVALGVAGEPPVEVLLHQADVAMYEAKRSGPGSFVRYAEDVDGEDLSRVARAS